MNAQAARIVDFACAALIGMVSCAALVGWVFAIPLLTQVSPSFNPIQFNTALCLALYSLGMVTIQFRGGLIARLAGAAIFAVGFLTLLENILGVSFGIDTISGYYVHAGHIEHQGRMATGTIYALLSLAASLWLRTGAKRQTATMMTVVGTLGSIAAAVGLGAIAGFYADLQSTTGWSGFPMVSLLSAVVCIVAGANVLWNAWRRSADGATLLPISLGIGLMTLLLVLNQSLRDDERAHARALSQSAAEHMATSTRDRLADMFKALDRMAIRWNAAGGLAAPVWESDARGYIAGYPGLVGIEMVDRQGHLQWVYPSPADAAQIEKRLHADPRRASAARNATRSGTPQLTQPLALVRGGWGVLYMSPLRVRGGDGGLQIAVIRIDLLLADVLHKAAMGPFHMSVEGAHARIFSTQGAPTLMPRTGGVAHMDIMGSQWTFSAVPSDARAGSGRSTLADLVLAAGTAIIVLITLSSFLALRWRTNNRRLRQREAELQRSEETFRTTMESAPVGMALLTPDGRRLGANRALCQMVGYTNDELMHLNPRELLPNHHDSDRTQIRRLVSGEIQNYEMEQQFIACSGKSIWVQVNASLARNTDGTPKHVVKQFLDISHRKEVDRLKSEFISVVSHELRTPLTAIRGSLGLLANAMGDTLPEKALHLVRIAHRNSERLIALVNDILDMEKLAAERMAFDMCEDDLVALVRQSLEANTPYAQKLGVTLELLVSQDPIPVCVDSSRMAQILANLLSNGAKFSPEGGTVDITVGCAGSHARVEVRDHGAGIPEAFRLRIFGRFAQADSSATRAKGGTGLGLHITKELTERMGGRIGFETSAGEGTTFWVELPLVKPAAAMEEPAADGRDAGKASILVCEDDLPSATMIREALEREGFRVDTVSTLAAARTRLARGNYVAMTLDLLLPDGDGAMLIGELRTAAMTKNLPIIVISLKAGETREAFKGSAIQVVDWLSKPLDIPRMVQAVRRAAAGGLPRILHVEDDADLSSVLAAALGGRAELVTANTLKRARALLAGQSFAAVVLDIGMPDGSGLSLVEQIAALGTAAPPIIILSAQEIGAEAAQQFAAAMVKSRLNEDEVVQVLLNIVNPQVAQPEETAH